MLIYVDKVVFEKTNNINNKLQIRARFRYKKNYYNLVVTDTKWENQFKDPNGPYGGFGNYSFNDGFYLTIGLGKELQENHYKLVVAVIPLQLVEEAQNSYEIDDDFDF